MKAAWKTVATLALMLGLMLPAAAAEQTITVSAMGEAKVKPDTLVVTGQITEINEKMKDAVTGFRDTHRRALAAINELGIENMTVSTSDLSVGIAGGPQGGPFGGFEEEPAAVPGALSISQTVTLTVSGIDQLEQQAVIDLVVKLMEGAKDAGIETSSVGGGMQDLIRMEMGMGGSGSGPAVFKISNPDAAYKAATKAAVEKARADAAYLAELAGGKLGPIVRISDGTPSDEQAGGNPLMMFWGAMLEEEEVDLYASETLDEITVARPLSISFKLITE